MKRLLFIVLLPLTLLTGCSRETEPQGASAFYSRYAQRQELKVAEVDGFKLSDTVRIDVVMLQAETEEAWQQLKAEFDIRGEEGTVSWLGDIENPALRTQWEKGPVMRVIASHEKQVIGFYRIDNEAQYDALIEYQINKMEK